MVISETSGYIHSYMRPNPNKYEDLRGFHDGDNFNADNMERHTAI